MEPSQRLIVVLAAAWFAACAPLSTLGQDFARDIESLEPPVWTADGMYLVRGHSGALFLTPPPHDLTNYRGAMLDEIEISTREGSRKLKPFEEERLKGYFTRRLAHVFALNGWPMVDAPGADVLRVRLAVRELELPRLRRSHVGKVMAGVSTARITIALELRDSVKRDRRLLYGDHRRLPFRVYDGTDRVGLRRVEDAFYDFSIDIRRRLDQVQRGEFPPPPRST